MPNDEVRVFVAVDIPQQLKDALVALAARLRLEQADPVRWVRPDSFHITIKFIGETPERQIAAINQAIAEVANAHQRFDLTLAGMGFFPNGANANHIFVGIGGDLAALGRLQRDSEAALSVLGYKPEGKPFKPHITLGRLRKEATHEQRNEAVGRALALQLGSLGSFTADGLHLMRSTLAPGGSIYQTVYFAPFVANP